MPARFTRRRWGRNPYLWGWGLFVLILLPAVLLKISQNAGYPTASSNAARAALARMEFYQLRLNSIRAQLQGHPLRADLERTLNDGWHFETQITKGPMVAATFKDPVTHAEYAMLFVHDHLMHYEYKPPPWASLFPPLPLPAGWAAGERIRLALARFAPVAWLALLPGLWLLRKRRVLLAQVLIGLAVLALLGRVLDRTWAFPRELPVPSALLLGSVAVLIWAIKTRPVQRYPACPACEYNLTGNTSGICPECGTPVQRPEEPANR